MESTKQTEKEFFETLEAEIRANFEITDPKWYLNSSIYYQDYVRIKKLLIYLCVEHKKISASKISTWCKSTPPNISYHKKDFRIFLEKRETHTDSLSQKILEFYDTKTRD